MRSVLLSDIGNVLLHVDREKSLRPLSEKLSCAPEKLVPYLIEHPVHRDLELGTISGQEFINRMLEALDSEANLSVAELTSIMGESFSLNQELIDGIEGYRSGVEVILLSNTNAIDIPAIEDRFGLISWADAAVLSYTIQRRKPSPAIYRYVIDDHHLIPEQTLFIDDLPENIRAAREFGIRAEVYESPEQVRALLDELTEE
ncbi:MAG TPA: HAD family phosphatase [bacterium]|nr:HAD family phosphatase [bacterium]